MPSKLASWAGIPVGVFMLAGPSGAGKTENPLTLADLLYGGEPTMITIAMSEFQEAHTVSTLKGSPPGYAGYGEGGVLTEAVRRHPYSAVLLDEVEKAHPGVLKLTADPTPPQRSKAWSKPSSRKWIRSASPPAAPKWNPAPATWTTS